MINSSVYITFAFLWGGLPFLLQITEVGDLADKASPFGYAVWGLLGLSGWVVAYIQWKDSKRTQTRSDELHDQMLVLQKDHSTEQLRQIEKQIEVMNGLKQVISEVLNRVKS